MNQPSRKSEAGDAVKRLRAVADDLRQIAKVVSQCSASNQVVAWGSVHQLETKLERLEAVVSEIEQQPPA